ncbi:hypothetical protein PGB90_002113 [Kerria lacca]
MPFANMTSISSRNIDFHQLKQLMDEKMLYLIDVREKSELLETGTLPDSVNIPLAEVESALQLSNDEFENKYSKNKPINTATIVFSCRLGKRSEMAMQTAIKLGYTNVLNYSGGWNDWEKQTQCSN